MQKLIYVLLASPLFLLGCSATNSSQPKYDVEIETISDQALKEVLSTPTEFFVPVTDSTAAWERARLFFNKYMKMSDLRSAQAYVGNNVSISNANLSGQKYVFDVEKQPFGAGFNFSIHCKPKLAPATSQLALRNAKNLARFIKDGTLEISFLDL